jgi:hypothetical protein
VGRLFSSANLPFVVVLAFVGVRGVLVYTSSRPTAPPEPTVDTSRPAEKTPRSRTPLRPSGPARAQEFGRFTLWWDGIPSPIKNTKKRVDTGNESNITRADYAGAESCQKCHEKNYESWSKHPHHWMNALASDSTVRGDFSPTAGIEYLGGKATFDRDGSRYLMHLSRGAFRRPF